MRIAQQQPRVLYGVKEYKFTLQAYYDMMSFHLNCVHTTYSSMLLQWFRKYTTNYYNVHTTQIHDMNVAYSIIHNKTQSREKLFALQAYIFAYIDMTLLFILFFFRLNKNVLQKLHNSFDVHGKKHPPEPL